MKLPNIKQQQGGGVSSSGAILPLTVQFKRDAEEQVAIMFEMTNQIMRGGKSPMPLVTKILIFVALFLVALVAFRMMDRFAINGNIFAYAGMGAGVSLLLAGLWGMSYQARMMAKFHGRVRSGRTCTVEINETGVRSSAAPAVLSSEWKNVTDIVIAKDCLLLTDEVWVHYLPARALPAGVSLSDLQEECIRARQLNESNPS